MLLEHQVYVPTLAVRASEMNGLEYLPAATKDRMFPCFLLAPWATSKTLDRTITRIERAFPNRSYFLDIDPNYQSTNIDSEPQRELAQLKDPANDYSNWRAFVEGHEFTNPCLQYAGQTQSQILRQIEGFQRLGRNYCLRIAQGRSDGVGEAISAVSSIGTADFCVILEGGWTTDPLTLGAWFSGMISASLNAIDAAVPVVISCTSIPRMFTEFSGDEPTRVPFNNRQLVEQIERGTNRSRVIYGDWGSTRPRSLGGFANRPLDRIDYPTDTAWYISRNKESEWNFRDAATALVASAVWDDGLEIWGTEQIANTVVNEELGIDTPARNVAARVNIHLHRQAFFGDAGVTSTFDEDWQD